MGHYGRTQVSYHAAALAGFIFVTVYSIWHRWSESTATGVRNNMKYNYWSTAPPQPGWIVEEDICQRHGCAYG